MFFNQIRCLLRRSAFWPNLLSALILLVQVPDVVAHGNNEEVTEQVEAMYVAYYGRPGDPGGIEYWTEQLEQRNGDLAAIIDAFGNSEEYQQRFAGLDDEALVNNIFRQLFGRDADNDGLMFFVGKLQSGELGLASIALDIYNGVQNQDAIIVANKLDVAHRYTDYVELNDAEYGAGQINAAKSLLANVDQTQDSVASAQQRLVEFFELTPIIDCNQFDGSFARIQSVIFDGYDCTNSACHGGANPPGGLDLRPEVAYQNLFRVTAASNLAEPQQLVYPGEQAFSFLYQKLAAGTNGEVLPPGAGTPMPVGLGPLTGNHLEALRLWIRAGAPEYSDVDEVAELLGCSEGTRAVANKIAPPAPPPIGEGVQFVSGPWKVLTNSENEVCFATYYDLEQTPELLPDRAEVPCAGGGFTNYNGKCFAYDDLTLTQDPQSHHSIIDVYTGTASPLDPSWGEWVCLNGAHAGQGCDPTRIGVSVDEGGADCGGALNSCGTEAVKSIACTGWGPRDRRQSSVSMGGAQTPISTSNFPDGVYSILPTRGVIIWNSHAFNLTETDTTIEQYNEVLFAQSDQRNYRNRSIFDSKDIFIANVRPYEQRTYCSSFILPRGARLSSLSSHAHKRGVLWQTWLPPQDPGCSVHSNPSCEPNDASPDYVSRIYNDPLVLRYDPPLAFDSVDRSDRTLKFCVTYDNGLEFPDLLKRNSTSVGTVCTGSAYCTGGASAGSFCGSDDSVCGDGGQCDACIVSGGVTTEDEMFILLGNYHVVPIE